MPTVLGPEYSTQWRGKPPHMLAPDIPIWYRFLEQRAADFINLYYDCLLGGPPSTPDNDKGPMDRMWRALTSKRADAIAETQSHVWLIEVASYPGMRSLGQLLTYHSLWNDDPKIAKPTRLVLVANELDPDIEPVYAPNNVFVYLA